MPCCSDSRNSFFLKYFKESLVSELATAALFSLKPVKASRKYGYYMLTIKDKKFLRKLQTDFPLVSRPFAVLAAEQGVTEAELLAYFKDLRQQGVLRYIAVMFELKALGIISSLIGMRVPADKLDATVAINNAYPNVSHNYLREGEYNVWFTVSAASERRLKSILADIRKKSGIKAMLDLRTRRVFKNQAVFELK